VAALLLAALDAFANAESSARSLRSSWRTRAALARAALAVLQARACAQGQRALRDSAWQCVCTGRCFARVSHADVDRGRGARHRQRLGWSVLRAAGTR